MIPVIVHRLSVCLLVANCLLLAACKPQAPVPEPAAKPRTVAVRSGEDSGALSSDAAPVKGSLRGDVLKGTNWPPLALISGQARVSCSADADTEAGDGEVLTSLDFMVMADAMAPCKETGVVRLRYNGKINGDFTALMQRAAAMADRIGIDKRILDIDSTGGRIEDAMPAGDAVAESHWTIVVRKDSICHSACVLVLAAGDDRHIEGRIGIHRMIRVGSKANSRAELSQELREVHAQVKDYLERNGASVAVADLMMTVPNRSLRLLSDAELDAYGLSGTNAVQDDLNRIRLARKCGDDFVKRKDAYERDYASECASTDMTADAVTACADGLLGTYKFPDSKCAAESPAVPARPLQDERANVGVESAADPGAGDAQTDSGAAIGARNDDPPGNDDARGSAPTAAPAASAATGGAAASATGGAARRR